MKLLRLSEWRCFVVTMWDVQSHHHVIYMILIKMDFGRRTYASQNQKEILYLSFCMNFLKNSNQIGRAWCKHNLACDSAPLCQIWGHLNNARWIYGPQRCTRVHRNSPSIVRMTSNLAQRCRVTCQMMFAPCLSNLVWIFQKVHAKTQI